MSDDYYTKDDFPDDLDIDESRFDREPDEETITAVVSNGEDRNIAVDVVGKLVSMEYERVDDRTRLVLVDEPHGF